MKKILLFMVACVCFSICAHAQLVQSSSLVVTKRAMSPVQKGFQSDLRLGVTFGNIGEYIAPEITYTAGYRFGNTFYLGAGAGLIVNACSKMDKSCFEKETNNYAKRYWYLPSAMVTVPVFAHMRVYFLNRRVSPFLDTTGGVMFTSQGRFVYGEDRDLTFTYPRNMGFATLSLGVGYRVDDQKTIYFLFGGKIYGVSALEADDGDFFNPYTITSSKPLSIGARVGAGIYMTVGFVF